MTTHRSGPRRRADASPNRLALYAALALVLGAVLMFVMPVGWMPLIGLACLLTCGLFIRAAVRARKRRAVTVQ